jgi:hypothetical protein
MTNPKKIGYTKRTRIGGQVFYIRESDGAEIPCDPTNRDYQEVLAYLSAGNEIPEEKK